MMTIKDLLAEYKTFLRIERGLSQNTVEGYLRDLIHFFNTVQKGTVQEITKEDIDHYLCLLNDCYASSSIERKMVALRGFYTFLMREGYLTHNLLEQFDLPKKRRKLPKVLSMEDIYQILSSLDTTDSFGMCIYCMILLVISTGMRVSELVNLKVSDINSRAHRVKVLGKGSKERIIPMDETTADIIKNYMSIERKLLNTHNSRLLFLSRKGEAISRENFYYILNKQAKEAGVKKHISPHMLRHTFATTMLEGNTDLRSIQELLGHRDISTSTIYTHVAHAKILEDYHKFHPGNREDQS